ncbi:MAG: hypothetical protein JSS53_00150 [Proteobacteria bacterium]|nr:hypothetical protein [Pseudomonadota bacterium]
MKGKIYAKFFMLMGILISICAFTTSYAFDYTNQVMFQVTGEQWVKTDSAKVNVTVNATQTQAGLEKVRQEILAHLGKIAEVEWHITRFDRSQDSSGLEHLAVDAEARVPAAQLDNLREKAKSVSQAGATYQISNVDYTPSLDEMEQAKSQLRVALYEKIKQELARLNTAYPQQAFTIHTINFLPIYYGAPRGGPVGLNMVRTMAEPAAAEPIVVSNQIKMTATVYLATTPVAIEQKTK